ncbi:MAG: molybdenum cofactor guanylyltransferase [archaeon]|nr:molybdenum cofactor guanylyltransferase [archaeon]
MKSCIVLCGGHSKRMGKDKGSLVIKDKPMIVHLLDTLNHEVDEVIIVLNDSNRINKYKEIIPSNYSFSITYIEDIIKDKGPLSGIMTGLNKITPSHALVLPCDSPFISKEHVNKLYDLFDDSFDALLPFSDDSNIIKTCEPLHAIYQKTNIKKIEQLIENNQLAIKSLIEKIDCKFIKIENKKEYKNLNSPKDLDKFN